MQRVAINGFGRIGRNVLRAWCEWPKPDICITAINDIADAATLLHLLRHDSTHGPLRGQADLIDIDGAMYLEVRPDPVNRLAEAPPHLRIRLLQEASPERLPWEVLGIDVVMECSGRFRSHADASCHLQAGAQRVIIGAAPFDRVDAAIVYGVNHRSLQPQHRIISSVSCTTQALVPLVKILQDHIGIESAMMTEIHAVTADQCVLDQAHRDLRRARAAGFNIIPTTSSALGALKQVLPDLQGRIEGYSIRVPTLNVAAIDLTFVMQQPHTAQQINQLFINAAQGEYDDILYYTEEPLVSSDFNHSPYSLIVDGLLTMTAGRQAKVYAWYDNEWGYANRLLDLVSVMENTHA